MKKIFFIPVFFFAAFVAAVYLVTPEVKNYQIAKQKVSQAEQRLQELENYVKQLGDIQSSLGGHQTEIDKINSALPEDPSLPSVLNFLQQKASENGVILTNVSIAQIVKKTNSNQAAAVAKEPASSLQEYKVSLTALVSAPALENFLKTIENSSRIIEVMSLNIAEKGKTTNALLKESSITLSVYSYNSN